MFSSSASFFNSSSSSAENSPKDDEWTWKQTLLVAFPVVGTMAFIAYCAIRSCLRDRLYSSVNVDDGRTSFLSQRSSV